MYTGDADLELGCVRMNILAATEMSTNPFYYFKFDGILGLGLKNLAVSDAYSYFDVLFHSAHIKEPLFGVFLSEGEDGEESEFAFGGFDQRRILDPLRWNSVALQHIGYWQVRILAVRIGGILLNMCDDGECRGVVDTGTSHLGIPAAWKDYITKAVSVDAADLLDCRLARAPPIEL
jgi:cathepsin D